jgi:CRISPR-associated protein Csm4
MLTYRATLQPRSATRSPWLADMLFGHLCWLIRYQAGEAGLRDLLDQYRAGPPPLLFSDGFPAGWLPRPLAPRPYVVAGDKAARVAAMQAGRREKSARWVSLAAFEALRRGDAAPLDAGPGLAGSRAVLKSQIDRLVGGTTPAEDMAGAGDKLYEAEELAFVRRAGTARAGLDVTFYVRAADEAWAALAQQWLMQLARGGYGAKKSAGYGHFAFGPEDWRPFAELDTVPPRANGFISLSNWVPARADPTDGFYTTLVKYGKLGEELANAENPFKFPLIMLAAGSCCYADTPIGAWYGRLVDRIAPADDRVVQYGYAFAVPAYLPPAMPRPQEVV